MLNLSQIGQIALPVSDVDRSDPPERLHLLPLR